MCFCCCWQLTLNLIIPLSDNPAVKEWCPISRTGRTNENMDAASKIWIWKQFLSTYFGEGAAWRTNWDTWQECEQNYIQFLFFFRSVDACFFLLMVAKLGFPGVSKPILFLLHFLRNRPTSSWAKNSTKLWFEDILRDLEI